MSTLNSGQVIANNYRLLAPIGRGGFGVVWKAEHLKLGREVAIKMLHGDAINRVPDVAARFTREVELAKRLEHPNVVRMYDFGALPDGSLFMVMEFISGRELKQIIISEGALGMQRSVKIIMQVLDALSEAHTLGIVHRDMKPANIMLTSKGVKTDVAKLLDFGIAKALNVLNHPGNDLTGTGAGFGTPQYMAPEQVMGREIGPYTDLYATGLILVECLTGQRAVVGQTPHEIAMKQVMEEVHIPPYIASTNLGVILRRALAKDPTQRFQTAAEMFSAIGQAEMVDIAAQTPQNPLGSPPTGNNPLNIPNDPYSVTSQSGNIGYVARPTEVSTPSFASHSNNGPISGPLSGPHSGPISGPISRPIYTQAPPSSPQWPSGDQGIVDSKPGAGRLFLLIGLGTGVVALAAAAAALLFLSSGPASERPDLGEAEAPTAEKVETHTASGERVNTIPKLEELRFEDEAAAETSPVVPETVILTIKANVEAEVFKDGQSVGFTPIELTEPKTNDELALTLRAKGHKDQVVVAKLQKSNNYEAILIPEAKQSSVKDDEDPTKIKRRDKKKDPEHDATKTDEKKRTFRRIGVTNPNSTDNK